MMVRTREIWAAKDGNVSFGLRGGPARIPNLKATVAYMDECGMAPQWLRDYDWDAYNHTKLSDAEIARLEAAFGAFFASRSMRELYTQALERRILLAPCNDAREIVEHVQLRDRQLFVRLDYPHLGASIEHPDFFAKVRNGRIALRRRAPRIGEHDAEVRTELERAPRRGGTCARDPEPSRRRKNILEGLRVLEIGSGAAGPVAASYLAEHGARVIRIESRERPDFLRTLTPHPDARSRRRPDVHPAQRQQADRRAQPEAPRRPAAGRGAGEVGRRDLRELRGRACSTSSAWATSAYARSTRAS